MENPESFSLPISPQQIYQYDKHTNIPWNIPEYQPRKGYLDPKMQVQQRKWASQKKGIKDTTTYMTKKGFYMDYELKVAKSIPSSVVHGKSDIWGNQKHKKQGQAKKIDQSLTKYTYIERIQMEQKNRKVPGISTYKLEKSMKQIEAEISKLSQKKRSQGEKRFFYQDIQHNSNVAPGPGTHNPHSQVKKLKEDKSDYKFWVTKHKKMNDTMRARDLKKPAAGTYSPRAQSFRTFDEVSLSPSKQKRNGFGSDSRFPYVRPQKQKIVQKRPDPISYNTTINWKGKKDSPKKKSWNEAIWKGSQSSVYH